jgi:hypothetical protein
MLLCILNIYYIEVYRKFIYLEKKIKFNKLLVEYKTIKSCSTSIVLMKYTYVYRR